MKELKTRQNNYKEILKWFQGDFKKFQNKI